MWNINGFTDFKTHAYDYVKYFQEFDIIALQETMIDHVDPCMFPGCVVFTTDPSHTPTVSRKGQGILLAVRERPDYGVQLWVKSVSSLWVKIQFAGNNHLPLYVGSVYLPPSGSPLLHSVDINQRLHELQGIINEIGDQGNILLAGDLNARIACVSTSQGADVRHVGQNTHGRKVMEFVHQTSLRLCTGIVEGDLHLPPSFRATVRSGPTRPDHVMVSMPLWEHLASINVMSDLKGSDHYPIHIRLGMRGVEPPALTEEGPQRCRIIWDARKRMDYVSCLEEMEIQLQECEILIQANKVQEALDKLVHTLKTAAREAGLVERVPQVKCNTRVKNKPFYDRECEQLKKEWRRQGRRLGYRAPEVLTLKRTYHLHVRSCKRRWMLQQLKEAIALYHANPKKFWKQLRGGHAYLPQPLLNPGIWQEFMLKLVTLGSMSGEEDSAGLSYVAYPLQMNTPAQALNEPFSLEEVEDGLRALNNNKAPGFLGYPAELLKYAQKPPRQKGVPYPHLLSNLLRGILNGLFSQGQIPLSHNISTVIPTLKDSKANLLDTGNYRPLAVPEPLMRLYSLMIDRRLTDHLEEHELRCQAQTSFRKGFSTLHQIFTLQHFIDRATPSEPLYVCKLDLSKAYDRVPRHLLWEALRRVGVQGKCLTAIKAIYDNAFLTMAVGKVFGDKFKQQDGITQGSPLSPTMWSLFGDGLIRFVQARCPHIGPRTLDGLRVCILLFADDIKLLATCEEDLQVLLDVVKEWCQMMNMMVNALKTHILIFPAPKPVDTAVFKYDGQPLEVVKSTKYLGIMFSSQGGLQATFNLLHGKMWGAWTTILRQYGNLRCGVSIGLLVKLLVTCVVPAGSYACELWCVQDGTKTDSGLARKDLETAFRTMIRMIVGAGKNVQQDILLAELGIQPIRNHWLKRMVTFWNSLVALPENHMYARILKDSCFYGVTTRSPSWAGAVMKTIRAMGYPYPIDCNRPHPIDVEVLEIVLNQVQDQAWHGLHISPRLGPSLGIQRCTYQRWFARPKHVSKDRLLFLPCSARKMRIFLRFRLGLHDLPIMTGRWQNIPRHERYCDMCSLPLVGDEQHFVFYCPALQMVRECYPMLFHLPARSRSLRHFIWQENTAQVVNFIVDGFAHRAALRQAQS